MCIRRAIASSIRIGVTTAEPIVVMTAGMIGAMTDATIAVMIVGMEGMTTVVTVMVGTGAD